MGLSRFLSILLVSLFLALFFSHGFGRKMAMETVDPRDDSTDVQVKENVGKSRMMIETMDYSEPEPNTNTNGGYVSPPPNQG